MLPKPINNKLRKKKNNWTDPLIQFNPTQSYKLI